MVRLISSSGDDRAPAAAIRVDAIACYLTPVKGRARRRCFRSRPALPDCARRSDWRPRPTPSVFPSSIAVNERAQGEAGDSVSPGTLPSIEVGAMPT